VIADVVEVDVAWLAVLDAVHQHADAGLPFCARTEACRIGQQLLEELDRHDRAPLVEHRLDAGHADVAEHLEVLEVVVGEAHPELRMLEARIVLGQRLELLVVHAVDLVGTDLFGAGEALLERHRRRGDERATLPVPALGGHLADVDLRVEVGRERVAVVATVDVDDVERADLVEVVLGQVGGEDVGRTGIEAGAEQRHQPGLLEPLLVDPLPLVLELRGVRWLVVGGVEVVHAGLEAGVHDGQVLVGQRDVDDQFRLHVAHQRNQLRHVVGVDPGGGDWPLDLRGDLLALGLVAARQHDIREDLGHLGALVGHDAANAAGTDDQYFRHLGISVRPRDAASG
jgi:hypothetical protein